jgi:hypothetical protein
MSANTLRGALGLAFRHVACVPTCASAQHCELRTSCPYARLFEPSALGSGPSGLADWPRPFVLRAMHLDGCTIPPGERFSFDVNLFELSKSAVRSLVLAFERIAQEGLGPHRGRAELLEVTQLNEMDMVVSRIYTAGSSTALSAQRPTTLSLSPLAESVKRAQVRFVTPTELKAGDRRAERPEFAVLAARIRDRLSTLRSLYDDGPLAIDFIGFAERAASVRLTRYQLQQVEIKRRSSRTGQIHPIGGFTGIAEYEGELAEFIPYLRAAKWTGVGRQTVWGKGQVEVSIS